VEKLFELGWYILQESENSVVRVLVSESIENKTLFGYESISVSGNPISNSRFNAPRIEIKLKTKKSIAYYIFGSFPQS